MNSRPTLLAVALLCACGNDQTPKSQPPPDTAMHSDDVSADGGRDVGLDVRNASDGDAANRVEGLSLMTRMAGLWVGAATQTPLGAFPIMPMDFRAADDHVLFGRVDLDSDNALRMAFFVEEIDGTEALVFRNGGLFMGLGRDTKTVLQSYDPTGVWHFCEPTNGCEYLDATIRFADDTSMLMDVKVRNAQHMYWDARRVESRTVPTPFPGTDDPIGTGDAPFPAMPTLEVSLSWPDPAPAGAGVWVILSDTECGLTGTGCNSSRSISATLSGGETAAVLTLDQIHGASYYLNAVLDRDGNWSSSPFPQTGDAIMFPVDAAVTVEPGGTTTTAHQISFDVP